MTHHNTDRTKCAEQSPSQHSVHGQVSELERSPCRKSGCSAQMHCGKWCPSPLCLSALTREVVPHSVKLRTNSKDAKDGVAIRVDIESAQEGGTGRRIEQTGQHRESRRLACNTHRRKHSTQQKQASAESKKAEPRPKKLHSKASLPLAQQSLTGSVWSEQTVTLAVVDGHG